ncbi:MAG TPA: polyphosphate kinase 1 [Verrucomicrobiales bacterium]|jgi:polyphosphate kinase|nr:polyphosphate kinase 1 [Verrucomicrobiales bacterium]
MKATLVDGVPFRSKEVSWLAFNSRVLQEAADVKLPLTERLKFLGIYSSNLDEFFRVRVATLRRLVQLGRDYRKLRLPDPKQTLKEAMQLVKRETTVFDDTYRDIFKALEKKGVRLIDETQVPRPLWEWLLDYFFTSVRPHIMPVMIRSYSRFSTLADSPMYLAVEMGKSGRKGREGHALIEIPTAVLPRFVTLPAHKGQTLVMYLDDIIRFGLPSLFSGLPYDDFHAYAIKFTRDSEMEFEDDVTASLYDKITEGLRTRQTGDPVRMNYDAGIPKSFLKLLAHKLHLSEGGTLLPGSRYHNRRDLMRFPAPKALGLPDAPALPHEVLSGARESIFRTLQDRDVLLHLPWHSFSHFLDFLREASLDSLTSSIQLTQYRLARNSCVARALTAAARNGKEVTVMVEPQARFDEKNNIAWANLYQEAGVRVILGVPGLKVHAKMCVVTRHEGGADRYYSALSTGNFNEDTANFYTDHLLLTAHQGIGEDIVESFRFFASNWQPPRLNHLVAAPFNLRAGVKFWIQNEMAHAFAGREASIFLKLNNLADPEITALLYEASQAGVEVRLIVRSMFSVITGDRKFSKHIRARGIVDHYLEHSRIFLFANGGNPRCMLSSADFLPRNFDSRFEIVFPILDEALQAELRHVMEIQWSDNVKARVLDRGLSNSIAKGGKKPVRSQEEVRKWLENGGEDK